MEVEFNKHKFLTATHGVGSIYFNRTLISCVYMRLKVFNFSEKIACKPFGYELCSFAIAKSIFWKI
jgi:hypothetical protein